MAVSVENLRLMCLNLQLEHVIKYCKIIILLIPHMPLSWAKYLLKSAAQEAEGCGTWCGVSDV